jgi:hypothetical protein
MHHYSTSFDITEGEVTTIVSTVPIFQKRHLLQP